MRLTVVELQEYANTHKFKSEPLLIRKGQTITDRKKYFMSNLAVIKNNRKNRTFKPYYDRLIEFIKTVKYEK